MSVQHNRNYSDLYNQVHFLCRDGSGENAEVSLDGKLRHFFIGEKEKWTS